MIDPELLADLQADLRRLVNIMKLPEWQRDLVRNVDTDLVRDIVADHRHPIHPAQDPSARVSVQGAGVVKTGDVGPQHRPVDPSATNSGGWVEAKSIDSWRPPGVDLCDRIADHFAALDRAERIREVAQSAAVQRALSEPQEQELKPKAQEPKARGDKKA
jgi:hypothetical protein